MNYRFKVFILLHAFIVSFVVSSVQVQATTPTHYAEMATALASIPFDIAAQHTTIKNQNTNNVKSAALLHVAADTLTILNKILFLYNNIKRQREIHDGDWTSKSRDFLVNGAFLIRGLMKFDQHLKTFMQAHHSEDENFSFTDLADPAIVLAGDAKEQEISKLAYAFEVVVLPSLKGLTAFALACTQDGATQYASRQARNLATATHSLVNLSEEYTMLKPDSEYKKLIAAMLFINTAWLVYELKKYIAERPAPYIPMQKNQGKCEFCELAGLDEAKELLLLQGCGHLYCKDCLVGHVKAKYDSIERATIDQTRCPHEGCAVQHISRGAMAEILDGDKDGEKILAAYDEAVAEHNKPKKPVDMTEEDKEVLKKNGTKPCPQCGEGIERESGCNYVMCKCRHAFCWVCLADYQFYRHAAPNCRAGLWGKAPDDNDNNDFVGRLH